MHKLRLSNKSAYPLTTAPALARARRKLLAQSTMTYTSVGGDVDLPVTAAVDVKAQAHRQGDRTDPDAVQWNDSAFSRVDLDRDDRDHELQGQARRARSLARGPRPLDGDPDGTFAQMSLEEFWSNGWRARWWWRWYGLAGLVVGPERRRQREMDGDDRAEEVRGAFVQVALLRRLS